MVPGDPTRRTVIRKPEIYNAVGTLTVGLQLFKGQYSIAWNLLMAGSVISVIPILILYIFLQKYFVEGIAAVSYTHLDVYKRQFLDVAFLILSPFKNVSNIMFFDLYIENIFQIMLFRFLVLLCKNFFPEAT